MEVDAGIIIIFPLHLDSEFILPFTTSFLDHQGIVSGLHKQKTLILCQISFNSNVQNYPRSD